MKVKITNSGESIAQVEKEITVEQFYFLKDLFEELNETGEAYSPYISIFPA